MWISKGIIDLHEGAIEVFSAGEGTGSTFSLRLPMIRKRVTRRTSLLSIPNSLNTAAAANPADCITLLVNSSRKDTSLGLFSEAQDDDPDRHVVTFDESDLDDPVPMPSTSPAVLRSILKSSDMRSLHILVVDDSAINRKMLCKSLALQGHSCIEAADGLEALDAVVTAELAAEEMSLDAKPDEDDVCRGGGFDVILLDYSMPNMDGR